MQLRESTKRAIMTHPTHEQKPRDWTQMPAYFQPQQSSLNKDASLQYGTSTHANERELLAVVEAPRSGATDSRLHRRILEAKDSMIMPPTSSPTNEIAASTAR
jgi:hypothetical protein